MGCMFLRLLVSERCSVPPRRFGWTQCTPFVYDAVSFLSFTFRPRWTTASVRLGFCSCGTNLLPWWVACGSSCVLFHGRIGLRLPGGSGFLFSWSDAPMAMLLQQENGAFEPQLWSLWNSFRTDTPETRTDTGSFPPPHPASRSPSRSRGDEGRWRGISREEVSMGGRRGGLR